MKRIFLICLIVPSIVLSQERTVTEIELIPNETISVEGSLSEGEKMEDLSWAWQSNNACFPATQYHKFTGNHVLYTGIIPTYSELFIKVIPKDEDANFSVYAYQVGVDNNALPPNLQSCVRCEVDHKWDRKWKGKTQDHTRNVKYILALNRSYRFVIGITGANELTEGDFTLEIFTKSN
ncbi:hypothetical protein KXJ69_11285 [Aureisphaera sp. CAU 1614]|uniref:Uncharacterized protein n=1 Tax=Halomarinibacterium sedimenti TaxID=2857106 RepID=A0A9X1FQ84_9FLAO|nr:hypothetical protein [Halomarinibacterium sedimenti]MBW2938694.1 hypothetical protein [Halomarinibacterium sedimenti]